TAPAAALEELARFLDATGADDDSERRARELASRAAERGPTVERWLLAAELAHQRGETARDVARARALSPGDPRARLAEARLRLTGPNPLDALPLLASITEPGHALEADLIRADVFQELGMPEAALAVLEPRLRHSRAPAHLWRLADLHREAGHADQVVTLERAAFEQRQSHRGLRRRLIRDAVQREEGEVAAAWLDGLVALYPDHVPTLLYVAGVREALGRLADAEAALAAARAVAPEDAQVH